MIFRGKLLEKSDNFTGNFGRKVRQETISKKTAGFAEFLLANFAKIDQFCVDMTSVGKRFFYRDNYFALSTTVHSRNERMLKLLTLWLVPSFSQHSSKNASRVVLGRCLLIAVTKFQAKFGCLG